MLITYFVNRKFIQPVEKVRILRQFDEQLNTLEKRKNLISFGFDQSFEILSCCDQNAFDIHFHQSS